MGERTESLKGHWMDTVVRSEVRAASRRIGSGLTEVGKTIAIGRVTKLITNSDDMPNVAKLSVA